MLGVLVLKETFTVSMGIGFGLVLLGLSMATRPERALPAAVPSPADTALRPASD